MNFSILRKEINSKNASVKELINDFFTKIDTIDPQINSFICTTKDNAIAQAENIDKLIQNEEKLPNLAGMPIAIKDNICTKGVVTTCASKMLKSFVAPYESTASSKLLYSGGICLGKTNLDEFAMGSSTETSIFGVTSNPWDINRVPGGSSGGSAASVAAGLCVAAIGSDTGGSIRQPASFCGVVGLKPTYGRVSRWGLVAFASSLDQIGPITNTVSDAAEILYSISGKDPLDSTCLDKPVPNYISDLNKSIKDLKIGIIKECFEHPGLNPEVKESVLSGVERFKTLGAEIIEVECPRFNDGIATYYVIAPCEASANLARYDGVKYGYRSNEGTNLLEMTSKSRAEGFGDEVQRRILIGTYALSAGYTDAYYKKAQKVRTLIRNDFDKAFKKVDILLTPTCPTTAFLKGDFVNDPLSMYLSDLLTVPANLAGLPAISIPCGFDTKGLPIGLQLIGNVLEENRILNAAHIFEIDAQVIKNRSLF
ncbi:MULTISPECIES: Asp-tRNA(Asn)/Glu-tRNA(Gln) amidotransferase subunit GatA [Prochlorococcus]|uniref:Glutamyl-tRNA(Gln) amidotransferase subunit A n=1 Tax=Prochlorococcus marinus str. MIT 9116 TaxID=167544 RepID=A0A0A1ZP94_PROMR|nr:Asp-tRNA(Asn)/Glu-tRNA(Gln) amidotransferase subunit GatA [Prochlorococcus marinus]KGF89634.1 Aspartyl-tRNA(Asn) amidotransferase subunit A Glutamyl-tRNA(Gln) amidotransferase subunit A [Prochlorococcus marinus str. MIT 9107]KGF90356.1 Aspartyl-tRNA(Asn) amidotransferase subunit A Glutamyl-tRNA(Gln) amidotransferase subunit A [Prochlorococcus marinus str. MIT 9116]KGF92836.1 Aspartyl-tRNA(Asn) amidotransferase subunit A Glutamyl-tRNA(Gln) amidotransferase subunit A [Prochlorococcus marinus st